MVRSLNDVEDLNGVINLPLFRRIEYPDPEITICENHPIWVNGTKLVNGHPVIDDKHKDETRLQEFKNLHFSKEYIQYLTDSKIYSYYFQGSKGKPIKYGTKLPGSPSYKGITKENHIHDPADYGIIHKIEIKDNSVYLNDVLIATSPAGKSKAQKERFCKSIVWALMNDPISLQDKLADIAKYGNIPTVNLKQTTVMPEVILVKMKSNLPVFPAGFIPWLNLTITEEVYV